MFGLSIGWRVVVFAAGMGLGFFCLLKTLTVHNLIGEFPSAENWLGAGGSYSMVKLIGLGFIVIAVVVLLKG